jgi:hypothetical protein
MKNQLSSISKYYLLIFAIIIVPVIWYITYAGSSNPNDIIRIQNVNYWTDFTDWSWVTHTSWESYNWSANFTLSFSGNKQDWSSKICAETANLSVINWLTQYDKTTANCVFSEFKQNALITVTIKWDINNNSVFTDSVDYNYVFSYKYASYYTTTEYNQKNLTKSWFIDNWSMWHTGKILDSRLPF